MHRVLVYASVACEIGGYRNIERVEENERVSEREGDIRQNFSVRFY
jgi:hypothetical protein